VLDVGRAAGDDAHPTTPIRIPGIENSIRKFRLRTMMSFID
jgi:hypothetical protein